MYSVIIISVWQVQHISIHNYLYNLLYKIIFIAHNKYNGDQLLTYIKEQMIITG